MILVDVVILVWVQNVSGLRNEISFIIKDINDHHADLTLSGVE